MGLTLGIVIAPHCCRFRFFQRVHEEYTFTRSIFFSFTTEEEAAQLRFRQFSSPTSDNDPLASENTWGYFRAAQVMLKSAPAQRREGE